MNKALTFRASSIGDGLMGKYFLENVHAAYPDARCSIVVAGRAAMLRDLFSAYPWLEVIEANRRDLPSLWRLFRDWNGSDIVLTQYAGKHGGRFALSSKLAARLIARRGALGGFTDASFLNAFLYDKLIPLIKNTAPAELERRALHTFSIPIAFPSPTLEAPASAFPKCAQGFGGYVVVHLFAGNTGRGIATEHKRELLQALRARMPHTALFVSGGAADRSSAETAAAGIAGTKVIAGEVSLSDMLGIVRVASGVVSLDTGMAHIAAQLRAPLIVLASCHGLHWWGEQQYGGGVPVALFTRADLCATGHAAGNYPACLNAIRMDEVASAARTQFHENHS